MAASAYHSAQNSSFQTRWVEGVIAVRGRHAVEGLMGLIDKFGAEEAPVEDGALLIVSFHPSKINKICESAN